MLVRFPSEFGYGGGPPWIKPVPVTRPGLTQFGGLFLVGGVNEHCGIITEPDAEQFQAAFMIVPDMRMRPENPWLMFWTLSSTVLSTRPAPCLLNSSGNIS
jgi:hypothetical protein